RVQVQVGLLRRQVEAAAGRNAVDADGRQHRNDAGDGGDLPCVRRDADAAQGQVDGTARGDGSEVDVQGLGVGADRLNVEIDVARQEEIPPGVGRQRQGRDAARTRPGQLHLDGRAAADAALLAV